MKQTAKPFTALPCQHAGIEAVQADTRLTFGRHTHETFGVGLMLHGAQTSASGRGQVQSTAGDLITVNPGEVHDGAPLGYGARSWAMLYADPALVSSLAHDISIEGQALPVEFGQPVLRDAYAARLFSHCWSAMTARAHSADPAQGEACLLLLLAHLLRAKADGTIAIPSGVALAKASMDDDPAGRHTLAALAEAAGLSRYTFLRGFARSTGLTPHAYLLQRRLHLARSLIAGGTALAKVAAQCGFADQSHLTRAFVRSFGLAPGAFSVQMRSVSGNGSLRNFVQD